MLNAQETRNILEDFLLDCIKFWLRNGKNKEDSFDLAVKDISRTTNDPNEPYEIKQLDVVTKEQFVRDLKIIKEIIL